MQISPFLLHYPSGVISIALRDEEKPDAFLLTCPQGTSYWVSLNFCQEVMSFEEATRKAAQIKIEGRRCGLLNLIPLRYLFQNWFKVCRLLQILGQKPLSDGVFWTKPQGKHYFYIRLDNQKAEYRTCNPKLQKAMVIAGMENFFLVQNDNDKQSLATPFKEKQKDKVSQRLKENPKLKPMQHH